MAFATHAILDEQSERLLLLAYHDPEGTPASRRAALDVLVQHNLRLVYRLARRYWVCTRRLSGVRICLDDLVSEGVLGLMDAIRTYDLGRLGSIRLASWAYQPVRARVWHLVRQERKRAVRERALACRDGGPSVAALLSTTDPTTREEMPAAWSLLDSRSRRLVSLRYGLNGERQHTLREMAALTGVCAERCRQLVAEALDVLRGAMTRSPVNRRSAS